MTAPVPAPPTVARARLRLRWARRQAARAVAATLRTVAEHLDPPVEHLARARVAHPTAQHRAVDDPDLAGSLARHPSTNADTRALLVEWHDRDEADDPRVRLLRPVHGEDDPR